MMNPTFPKTREMWAAQQEELKKEEAPPKPYAMAPFFVLKIDCESQWPYDYNLSGLLLE